MKSTPTNRNYFSFCVNLIEWRFKSEKKKQITQGKSERVKGYVGTGLIFSIIKKNLTMVVLRDFINLDKQRKARKYLSESSFPRSDRPESKWHYGNVLFSVPVVISLTSFPAIFMMFV